MMGRSRQAAACRESLGKRFYLKLYCFQSRILIYYIVVSGGINSDDKGGIMNTKENMKLYRADAGMLLRLAREANKRGKPYTVAQLIDRASGLLEIDGLQVRARAWLKSRHAPVLVTPLDKAAIEGFLAGIDWSR